MSVTSARRAGQGQFGGRLAAVASRPPHHQVAASASAAAERFERHPHEVADAEVLGVVLAGGRLHDRSTRLARELLADAGGLAPLPGASKASLLHRGLPDTQALARSGAGRSINAMESTLGKPTLQEQSDSYRLLDTRTKQCHSAPR